MTGGQPPVLELGDEKFRLSSTPPGGLIFKIADAEASGDAAKTMALTIRMLRAVIDPADTGRFDAFYDSDAFDRLGFDEVAEAVKRAVERLADGRPTPRSASSPPGQRASGTPSKVVSLSPATNRGSSPGGRSAAS